MVRCDRCHEWFRSYGATDTTCLECSALLDAGKRSATTAIRTSSAEQRRLRQDAERAAAVATAAAEDMEQLLQRARAEIHLLTTRQVDVAREREHEAEIECAELREQLETERAGREVDRAACRSMVDSAHLVATTATTMLGELRSSPRQLVAALEELGGCVLPVHWAQDRYRGGESCVDNIFVQDRVHRTKFIGQSS